MNEHQPRSVKRVDSVPHLVRKETLAALVSLVVLFVLSAVSDAPLVGPADPAGVPAEGVKAPWIFVGIQQLLRYFSPLLAGIVIPLLGLALIAALPYAPAFAARRRLVMNIVFYGLLCAALALTVWGYAA